MTEKNKRKQIQDKKVEISSDKVVSPIPGLAADLIARAKQNMVEPRGVAVAQVDVSQITRNRIKTQAELVVYKFPRVSTGDDVE